MCDSAFNAHLSGILDEMNEAHKQFDLANYHIDRAQTKYELDFAKAQFELAKVMSNNASEKLERAKSVLSRIRDDVEREEFGLNMEPPESTTSDLLLMTREIRSRISNIGTTALTQS
jgi:hypothetical protein